MNVDDMSLTEEEKNPPHKTEKIFSHQSDLMNKYHGIEQSNGLLQYEKIPVSLDSRFGQARLKDFAWRITEELGEATEALEIHSHNITHYQEEMIDALHFYVELLIISDVSLQYINNMYNLEEDVDVIEFLSKGFSSVAIHNPQEDNYKVVQYLSNAMNLLKNKPWKQTHMMTDSVRYRENLVTGFTQLVYALFKGGMNPAEIYQLYVLKNKVNKFRQRTNY